MDAWVIVGSFVIKNNKNRYIRISREIKETYDINVKFINYANISIALENGNTKIFLFNKEVTELPKYAVILRYDIYLIKALESLGVRCINSSSSIINARNKLKTYQILNDNNVPVPNTYYKSIGVTYKFLKYDKIKEYFNSNEFIMKTCIGSKGKGVFLIKNEEEFIKRTDTKSIFFFQEYIKESSGEDIRIYLSNHKVIAALKRKNENDFRSNTYQGGDIYKVNLDKECERLAIKVSNIMDLELCSIDLLKTNNGYKVCEVNSVPGLLLLNRLYGIKRRDIITSLILDLMGE